MPDREWWPPTAPETFDEPAEPTRPCDCPPIGQRTRSTCRGYVPSSGMWCRWDERGVEGE